MGDSNYLGLQPGHSITIDVALVFWDSGRAAIATDSAGFFPADTNTDHNSPITNPYFFFDKNLDGTSTARYVVDAAKSTDAPGRRPWHSCGVTSFHHGHPTRGRG